MRALPISHYIFLGTAVRYLQDARAGEPYTGTNMVKYNIEKFFSYLEEYSMQFSFRASYRLQQFKKKTYDEGVERLSNEHANELGPLMRNLREVILAESGGKFAFITGEKRFSTEKLLYDISSLMADGVYDQLPTIAQYDFVEAGICIAFDRSTAAAFHILRGTEAVLKQYYNSIVKRGRMPKPMWGNMVLELGKRRDKDQLTLEQLDIIRRSYRNPTQHPEKIYDTSEVQSLFPLCIHALELMIGHKKYIDPNS